MQRNRANHLNIEDPHAERTLTRFSDNRKGFRQKRLERLAGAQPVNKLGTNSLKLKVRIRLKLRFKPIHPVANLFQPINFSAILSAEQSP